MDNHCEITLSAYRRQDLLDTSELVSSWRLLKDISKGGRFLKWPIPWLRLPSFRKAKSNPHVNTPSRSPLLHRMISFHSYGKEPISKAEKSWVCRHINYNQRSFTDDLFVRKTWRLPAPYPRDINKQNTIRIGGHNLLKRQDVSMQNFFQIGLIVSCKLRAEFDTWKCRIRNVGRLHSLVTKLRIVNHERTNLAFDYGIARVRIFGSH